MANHPTYRSTDSRILQVIIIVVHWPSLPITRHPHQFNRARFAVHKHVVCLGISVDVKLQASGPCQVKTDSHSQFIVRLSSVVPV